MRCSKRVFYDSRAVAAKQRVYVSYLDRELTTRWPFFDLSCGRGNSCRLFGRGRPSDCRRHQPDERLPRSFRGIQGRQDDLIAFLNAISACVRAPRYYRGRTPDSRANRANADAAGSEACPGFPCSPSKHPIRSRPLRSPHFTPIRRTCSPCRRGRPCGTWSRPAAFERARTLFQARIPRDQFVGPDPRDY